MSVYDAYQVYDVTCPANTPTTAPIEITTYPGGDDTVVGIEVVIPDGHAGLTGIAFAYGHTPIYPENTGGFVSGNDEVVPIVIADVPHGVSWSVFLCNRDNQPHTWQTRWALLQSSKLTSPTFAAPLSARAIEAAAAIG